MSENLFNSSHKATNDKYREGYDRIFGKENNVEDAELYLLGDETIEFMGRNEQSVFFVTRSGHNRVPFKRIKK